MDVVSAEVNNDRALCEWRSPEGSCRGRDHPLGEREKNLNCETVLQFTVFCKRPNVHETPKTLVPAKEFKPLTLGFESRELAVNRSNCGH